jgi:hypothetical protein
VIDAIPELQEFLQAAATLRALQAASAADKAGWTVSVTVTAPAVVAQAMQSEVSRELTREVRINLQTLIDAATSRVRREAGDAKPRARSAVNALLT